MARTSPSRYHATAEDQARDPPHIEADYRTPDRIGHLTRLRTTFPVFYRQQVPWTFVATTGNVEAIGLWKRALRRSSRFAAASSRSRARRSNGFTSTSGLHFLIVFHESHVALSPCSSMDVAALS